MIDLLYFFNQVIMEILKNPFYWMVTSIAIIGVILNIKKDKRCFIIWTFTNGAFALESFIYGAYNMSFLFSIYFILALWGLKSW